MMLEPPAEVEPALREEAVDEADEEDGEEHECWKGGGGQHWAEQGRRGGWIQNTLRSSVELTAEWRSVKERLRPVLYNDDRPSDDRSREHLPRDLLPRDRKEGSNSSSSR